MESFLNVQLCVCVEYSYIEYCCIMRIRLKNGGVLILKREYSTLTLTFHYHFTCVLNLMSPVNMIVF